MKRKRQTKLLQIYNRGRKHWQSEMFCYIEEHSWINHELIIECIVGKMDGELLPFLSNHNWRLDTPFYVLKSGLLLIKGPTICSMGQCSSSSFFFFALVQPSHWYEKWHKCSDLCSWHHICLDIQSILFIPPPSLLHGAFTVPYWATWEELWMG